MALEVPEIALSVSVTAMDSVEAVFSVTEKVPVPFVNAALAGRTA
jgi:hypothetical protein